jgi:transposase
MQAYLLDWRTRIVEAGDRQVGSQGVVATLFGVSRTFVKKLVRQRRETGSLAPEPPGGGHTPKLNEERQAAVQSYTDLIR